MSIRLKRSGTLFVISAPSGGGKSTVLRALLPATEGLKYSVSVTSRPPRDGEREGVDYYFVSTEEFQSLIDHKEFYEWAKVHGNYYGTRKSVVESLVSQGYDVALDLDVQGACQIKGMKPDSVTIFLLPPSTETLEKRLRGRETDDEEVVRLRMHNAVNEIAQCGLFDYLVVNENLDRTIAAIRHIIDAERQRGSRQRLVVENEPRLQHLP
jgi:guanylate kinase